MGKARAAPKAAQQRLCLEKEQTPGELFGSSSTAGAGSFALSFPGLPSFTVNPRGPAEPDILGDVLYDSIASPSV